MNNTVLAGLIVGAVVVSAAGAIALNSGFNPLQEYATVVDVKPAFDTNRVPRQVCGDEATLAQATAAGGAATATPPQPAADKPEATAASGQGGEDEAAAGDCVMVYDTESVPAGFDVTYELDGVQRVVRMEQRPGERIPVKDGELVLTRSS